MIAKLQKLREIIRTFNSQPGLKGEEKQEIQLAYTRLQESLREELEKERKRTEQEMGINIIGINEDEKKDDSRK